MGGRNVTGELKVFTAESAENGEVISGAFWYNY
jgi:hypothetical protein